MTIIEHQTTNQKIRPCEREWSADKAAGVVALVEKLTGKPCPCDRGVPCPLLPNLGG